MTKNLKMLRTQLELLGWQWRDAAPTCGQQWRTEANARGHYAVVTDDSGEPWPSFDDPAHIVIYNRDRVAMAHATLGWGTFCGRTAPDWRDIFSGTSERLTNWPNDAWRPVVDDRDARRDRVIAAARAVSEGDHPNEMRRHYEELEDALIALGDLPPRAALRKPTPTQERNARLRDMNAEARLATLAARCCLECGNKTNIGHVLCRKCLDTTAGRTA